MNKKELVRQNDQLTQLVRLQETQLQDLQVRLDDTDLEYKALQHSYSLVEYQHEQVCLALDAANRRQQASWKARFWQAWHRSKEDQ